MNSLPKQQDTATAASRCPAKLEPIRLSARTPLGPATEGTDMTTTIRAMFDGQVFRPDEPPDLPANTPVILQVQTTDQDVKAEPYAFFKFARQANVEGPPDWSTNVDEYLAKVRTERDE
jgi:hypothetical protein